jgi:hypothetical protein
MESTETTTSPPVANGYEQYRQDAEQLLGVQPPSKSEEIRESARQITLSLSGVMKIVESLARTAEKGGTCEEQDLGYALLEVCGSLEGIQEDFLKLCDEVVPELTMEGSESAT